MDRTIAEKILSRHAGRNLKAGDIAICKVDFCFGQDGTSSLIIDSFEKSGKKKDVLKNMHNLILRKSIFFDND